MNLTVTNGSKFTIVANQLSCGVSNGLNEIFSSFSTNQSSDIVFAWNPRIQGFYGSGSLGAGYYFYQDPVAGPTWYDQGGNGNLVTTMPTFPVGTSFFVQGGGVAASDTLTQVGSVQLASTNGFLFSGFSLSSSVLPISGGLYNSGFYPPDGTIVFIWNPVVQGFIGNGSSGTGYAFFSNVNNPGAGGWYDQGGNGNLVTGTGITATNAGATFSDIPIIAGQGFYIQGPGGTYNPNAGTTNWVETLNIQ